MKTNTFNVGIVGYGIGKIYAAALKSMNLYYPDLPQIKLSGIATHSKISGENAINQFNFQYASQNFMDILNDPNTDAVVICTPTYLHYEMISEALETSKAIFIDKPLALNFSEAKKIVEKSREKNKNCHLGFEFRFCPAIIKAKELIDAGKLGEIYSYRINYFRPSAIPDNKNLKWKGQIAKCGDGVVNDYGPHIVDLAIWLTGLPNRLAACRRIYTKKRPDLNESEGFINIDAADHYLIQTEINNGVMGSIETSRMIVGSDNTLTIEICGSKGSIKWSLMSPNYLNIVLDDSPYPNSWVRLMTGQNYPKAILPGKDMPVGMMRFHVASFADFVVKSLEGKDYSSNLIDGLKTQAFIESATKSAHSEKWEILPELGNYE
jgi:levoglucosan dehydrogenase